ncbi:ferredoxin [Thermomonospora catenispora]|uniref:ferredoxin n=1 Tax=Thermomonospora catenispora TaxID=2493090 RepID=UPI0011237DA0|nr:ferredoxin [Thermomonospora catenispora]TNY34500.1 ferredoxin [Thermomonospora catenispora]
MTVRPDVRLEDMPMRPVRCRRCGVEVLVRKASWEQTSIQWSTPSMTGCAEPPPDRHRTCPSLLESIGLAAAQGDLEVLDG